MSRILAVLLLVATAALSASGDTPKIPDETCGARVEDGVTRLVFSGRGRIAVLALRLDDTPIAVMFWSNDLEAVPMAYRLKAEGGLSRDEFERLIEQAQQEYRDNPCWGGGCAP